MLDSYPCPCPSPCSIYLCNIFILRQLTKISDRFIYIHIFSTMIPWFIFKFRQIFRQHKKYNNKGNKKILSVRLCHRILYVQISVNKQIVFTHAQLNFSQWHMYTYIRTYIYLYISRQSSCEWAYNVEFAKMTAASFSRSF